MIPVRTTHLNDFHCPKRYAFMYLEDSVVTDPYEPFVFGGVGHFILEKTLIDPTISHDKAFDMWKNEVANSDAEIALAVKLYPKINNVLTHHYLFWKWKDHLLANFDIEMIEHTFERHFSDYLYRGTIDGLIYVDGRRYLLEHKFVSNVSRYKRSIPNSLQPHVYLHYMRQEYPDIVGVLYNLILKETVTYPEPYKSKRKEGQYKLKGFNATAPMLQLWEAHHDKFFGAAVHSHVQTDKYEQQRFHRFIYAPTANQMKIMMDFVESETRKFVAAHKANHFPRRINYSTCTYCAYKSACLGLRL